MSVVLQVIRLLDSMILVLGYTRNLALKIAYDETQRIYINTCPLAAAPRLVLSDCQLVNIELHSKHVYSLPLLCNQNR